MYIRALAATVALVLLAEDAWADWEFSAYLGYQTAPASDVDGFHPDTGSFDASMSWKGKSFDNPPYYGARLTYWTSETLGYSIEATHAKVDAPVNDKVPIGFDELEFTDGLNIVTINVHRRWPNAWQNFTPYIAGGIGLSIPHVDARTTAGTHTYGFQVTGPAIRGVAGASYDLADNWALFGEYQFTWSSNDADLDGGGSLNTDIFTNAFNFGFTYKF